MSAAIHVIAVEGLGAPTAKIAKTAGVSNGSLFTYFETKADLLNQLYIELKTEMANAALDELPAEETVREQMYSVWTHWLSWATSWPEKRRALMHLGVSDDITLESHQTASRTMGRIAGLLERSRENGPMRDAPVAFAAALMNALADVTTDFMIREPARADEHASAAFEALWRLIA